MRTSDRDERIESLFGRAADEAFCLTTWADECRRSGRVREAEEAGRRAAIVLRRAARLREALQDEIDSTDLAVMAESFAEWRADARTR